MKRAAAGLCVVMMLSGAVPVGVIGGVAAINASADTRTVYTPPVVSYLKGNKAVKLSWNEIEGAERYAIAGYVNGEWKMLDRNNGYYLYTEWSGCKYRVQGSCHSNAERKIRQGFLQQHSCYTQACLPPNSPLSNTTKDLSSVQVELEPNP